MKLIATLSILIISIFLSSLFYCFHAFDVRVGHGMWANDGILSPNDACSFRALVSSWFFVTVLIVSFSWL